MKKFLVINGPNINMLGFREKDIYGSENYEYLCNIIRKKADEMGVEVELFQSNYEGGIITKIQDNIGKTDGVIINPAAYTHTSIGILDALKMLSCPIIEVHISDINDREEFRHTSITSLAANESVIGEGLNGYIIAMERIVLFK